MTGEANVARRAMSFWPWEVNVTPGREGQCQGGQCREGQCHSTFRAIQISDFMQQFFLTDTLGRIQMAE